MVAPWPCTCQATWIDCLQSPCTNGPIQPPFAPVPVPVPVAPVPVGCSPTPPGIDFICVGGVWTSNGSVSQPTISIGGTTVVSGNLTTTTITIIGSSTQVNATGCVYINGTVQVQFTQQDLTDLENSGGSRTSTLIQGEGSNCTGSISNTPVSATVTNGGCKSLSSTNVNPNDHQTLTVLFSVDSSGCNTSNNTTVIIAAATAGGGVAILVIAAVVGIVLWRKHRLAEARRMTKVIKNLN